MTNTKDMTNNRADVTIMQDELNKEEFIQQKAFEIQSNLKELKQISATS